MNNIRWIPFIAGAVVGSFVVQILKHASPAVVLVVVASCILVMLGIVIWALRD